VPLAVMSMGVNQNVGVDSNQPPRPS
jgi:hypothetical protein